jgi:toxin YoeB
LIRDIKRHPDERIGKPETLRFELSGKLSRRINKEHRRVYQIIDGMLVVFQCRYHYQQE